ncbi:hypothetical protein B0H17DRAFT_1204492 [Mycena rosella]|uniref:Uncharacterized protein n=1 Tax=Mycena rosella TaxID=1033263 RepID=A0AAD7D9C2_MYCRO|nr:hypothetical protein B0H17DRAFT_1217743 [Mycena rosella]KAJ7686105.1 hypothetical protein B0H17DRAFT_1204492 [Mycena rosella]
MAPGGPSNSNSGFPALELDLLLQDSRPSGLRRECGPLPVKQRPVVLELSSSPALVPAHAAVRECEVRRIDVTASEDGDEGADGDEKPLVEDGPAKARRKWTPERRRYLSTGVIFTGTGNWKITLSDPNLFFANRSLVD